MLNIYIANLGKYNEGYLVGKWVELPCDNLEEVYKEIGVEDGTEYEEVAIHDYETDLPITISEYSSIDKLNEIAEQIEEMDEHELNTVLAYLEVRGGEFEDAVDEVDNCYLYENIDSAYKLGEYMIDEVDYVPKECNWLFNYFDYEAYGESFLMDEFYLTDYGVLQTGR